jgi:hypothetical protein
MNEVNKNLPVGEIYFILKLLSQLELKHSWRQISGFRCSKDAYCLSVLTLCGIEGGFHVSKKSAVAFWKIKWSASFIIHYWTTNTTSIPVKIGQVLRISGSWSCKISKQSAHEGGKVSALHICHLYPSGNILGTRFCKTLIRIQGHCAAGRVVNEKSQWHHRELNLQPSDLYSSASPPSSPYRPRECCYPHVTEYNLIKAYCRK